MSKSPPTSQEIKSDEKSEAQPEKQTPLLSQPSPRVVRTSRKLPTSSLTSSSHGPQARTPWYGPLTIDMLVSVTSRTLLNPISAWLGCLGLRAQAAPYDSLQFRLFLGWAIFLTLCHLLGWVNDRVAYGTPREIDWSKEVVVITGGASGLGRTLAEMLGLKGVNVAVLDTKPLQTDVTSIRSWTVDVRETTTLKNVHHEIERDCGPVTIIVNNAAIVPGKRLLDLTDTELDNSLRTNLLGPFHVIRTFLPSLLTAPNGGTIVTISSVLAHLGAAQLADYTAAKAGLTALHSSLAAELDAPASSKIKTLLVAPGQLRTTLFGDMRTPSPFFAPMVNTPELAGEIVKALERGQSGTVVLPLYARWIAWLAVLPVGVQRALRGWSGIDGAMVGFRSSASS